jgi:hypothetical protein
MGLTVAKQWVNGGIGECVEEVKWVIKNTLDYNKPI